MGLISFHKVGRKGIIGIKGFNNSKKKLPAVGLDLMQEIITGLGVQLNFLDLDDLVRINRA